VRGGWAIAKLRAPSGTQWVLLRRRGDWRVVDQVSDHASRLWCGLAPAGVVRALAGSCANYQAQWDLAILGPTARRPATRAERRAVAPADCASPTVYVSRLDPDYAELDNCAASGGAFLVHREAHGWREVGLEVDGFVCSTAPAGVIRSLHGRCLLAG
jgi:hypothetical protein